MVDRSTFDEVIKDVLGNLYDTAAIETHPLLFTIIQPPPSSSNSKVEYIRKLVLDAIEQLRPGRKDESISSPEWRPYFILYKRYVEGMGVQELSDLLAISTRQMRRDHHRALVALTEILWTKCYPNQQPSTSPTEALSGQLVVVHNELIDVVETTHGVYRMLKRRFDEKKVAVDIRSPENLAFVITDRVILRQALIGIFNECLHVQIGGQLKVKFENTEGRTEIILAALVSSRWEPADAEEVDDDLSAVRYWCSLIDAHLQETILQQKEGQLIQWIVRLPHSSQRTILVIDDQTAVVSLFKRYLSQTNILPVGVEEPAQALALAHHLQPVLITLDVMMPQMDGWELLQTLKLDEKVKHIPIIVCSAWDDPDLSRSLGAAAFLKKPVTQKMLLDVIEKFVPPE